MPNGHAFFAQFHVIQGFNLGEQACQHFAGGEVFFHFGFGKGVFGFAQFFAGIRQIP